ncbi:vWA domain-containing protein [Kaarinaea lacus]
MKSAKLIFALGIVVTLVTTASPLLAKQVDVKVALSTPVMPANKTQTTFLKISLEGFELANAVDRVPANVAIVLDKSGSMQGEKIVRAKEAAIVAVNAMNANDIVSVITYDDVVRVIVPGSKVADKHSIISQIQTINAGGSTALFAGVSKGAAEVRKFIDKERVNRVILLSDGQANVGPSAPSELGQLGASLAKEGISVTTIGLGTGYNEDLMTQLAGYSDGNHAFVENAQDLAQVFKYEFGDVFSVVAQDVDVIIKCQPGVRPLRVLGRNAEIYGDTVKIYLNQLYSAQEKFVLLEVEVPSQQSGRVLDLAKVDVSYNNMLTKNRDNVGQPVQVAFSASEQDVFRSTDKTVVKSAASQVANEISKRAVELRDKGQVKEAQKLLNQGADFLGSQASQYDLPELKELEQDARKDADELEKKDWTKKRKSLRAKQYKLENQQSY